MSLTSTQKNLVQTSFLQIIDEIAFASQTFYDRLFELDPSLRTLFKEDKTVQGRKLMQALLMIVNGLDTSTHSPRPFAASANVILPTGFSDHITTRWSLLYWRCSNSV